MCVHAGHTYISVLGKENTPSLQPWPKSLGLSIGFSFPLLNPNRTEHKSGGITFAESYHGKVVPLQAAKQLVAVQEEVCLENLEQVIP
jgi:hypothetical protein